MRSGPDSRFSNRGRSIGFRSEGARLLTVVAPRGGHAEGLRVAKARIVVHEGLVALHVLESPQKASLGSAER